MSTSSSTPNLSLSRPLLLLRLARPGLLSDLCVDPPSDLYSLPLLSSKQLGLPHLLRRRARGDRLLPRLDLGAPGLTDLDSDLQQHLL